MNRLILCAALALSPAAYAQPQGDRIEGQKLAAAFSQADLDTLGACQARIEGVGVLLADIEGWLAAENQTTVLDSLRNQKERGAGLIDTFETVRQQTSTAKGMTLASSDKAYADMLATFNRQPGEDERSLYARAHPQTRLPADCGDALKRGRWKVEIDGLGGQ